MGKPVYIHSMVLLLRVLTVELLYIYIDIYSHDKIISAPFIMKCIVTKWYKDGWMLFRET